MYFTIDAAHPSLPGHFPGNTVVPGVVVLSHVLAILNGQSAEHSGLRVVGIKRLKFLRQVLPGQRLRLVVEPAKRQSAKPEPVGFECWLDDTLVLSGIASYGV
jgi:3-hydroxyacyl-[acyl-carrier-protein] dehydratase